MLKELTEYDNNTREEMKVTISEIKKNPQGTNSEGNETRIQINNLEHKEEINIQPEQKEETRVQRNEQEELNSQPVQNEGTRIQKKLRENRKTLGHLQTCQHLNHRGARRTRARH